MTHARSIVALAGAITASTAIAGGGPMNLVIDGRIIVGYGEAFGFEGNEFSSEQQEPIFAGLEFMTWSEFATGDGFLSGGGGNGFASQTSTMNASAISGSGSTNASASNDGTLDFASGLGSSELQATFEITRPTRFRLDAALEATGEGRAWARVSDGISPFPDPHYELSTVLGDDGGTVDFTLPAGQYSFVLRSDVSVTFFNESGSASGTSSFDGSLETGTGCNGADLNLPEGVLDFSDVAFFIVLFAGDHPLADFAPPIGVRDFSDVVAFLAEFGAGCP